MKPKYWVLLACVICGMIFGITAAALTDAGGHKALADCFTAFGVMMIFPIVFIIISVMADLGHL